MRFKLRTKLILLSVFIVIITMATVTYFFTIGELRDQRLAVQTQMSRIASNIATLKLLDKQSWSDYQNYISRLMASNKDIVYIAIYDDRKWLRAHTLNPDLLELEFEPPLSPRLQSKIVEHLDQIAQVFGSAPQVLLRIRAVTDPIAFRCRRHQLHQPHCPFR